MHGKFVEHTIILTDENNNNKNGKCLTLYVEIHQVVIRVVLYLTYTLIN